jgi:hypothetical protein
MPVSVRDQVLDLEDKLLALLGVHIPPREGRGRSTDTEEVGKLISAWELLSASVLLLPDEEFERIFGIGARGKR